MSGVVESLSINGVPYNVPDDQEVTFNKGGIVSKEFTTYGNRTTRGHKMPDPGKISGIIVDVDDDAKFENLQDAASKKSIDVACTLIDGTSYGGAGEIIADNGITKNFKTGNLNDEIMIIAINGKFDKL